MKIYIITPVRNGTPTEVAEYVADLERQGHTVHFPPRDVDQNDPTGAAICTAHFKAMLSSDEVHIFWDKTSSGSHFDFGMAYVLKNIFGKPRVKLVKSIYDDGAGKSYEKVIRSCND